jgi:hypothetical protein
MPTGGFVDTYNSGQGKFYRKVFPEHSPGGPFTEPSRFHGGGHANAVATWSPITMPVDHEQQLGSNFSMGINVIPIKR